MSAAPHQPARSSAAAADSAASTASGRSKRRASGSSAASFACCQQLSDNASIAALIASASAKLRASAAGVPASPRKKHKNSRSSASVAPAAKFARWATLYTDALHSIFQFASLQDLARLMSVSRQWGESVLSTPPVAASAVIGDDAHLTRVLSSRMRRHISSLQLPDCGGRSPYQISSTAELQLVCTAPWLTELSVGLRADDSFDDEAAVVCASLLRFPLLRDLTVEVFSIAGFSNPAIISGCNRIVNTIGSLSALHTLNLVPSSDCDVISLDPLAALKQLRVFSFGCEGVDDEFEPPP